MADATTIKGGKVRILLGTPGVLPEDPIDYAALCGFRSRSVTLNKALEDSPGVSCDNPDKIKWLLRDAVSLSMSVNGEGLLAAESVKDWIKAWKSEDSVPAKIEIDLPGETITFTGNLHIENVEIGAENGRRVTLNVSAQSDGEMADTIV